MQASFPSHDLISGRLTITLSRVLLLILFLTLVTVEQSSPTYATDLIVQTKSGAVQGVNVGSVNQWRGIPYAAPPVGNRRWKPPTPPAAWVGVRDGSAFGSHCIQLETLTTTLGSEDCLFLNVSVPVGTPPASSLPVMVHLHGGSNTFNWGYEDAHVFVDQGVIVVTLNYRLGMLGWLAHPALTAEGGSSSNYGLMDQIAALRWVQDNIAAFGGDATNVTLFGFSAGAFDTAALMASPLAQGLFKRVALQPEDFWTLTGAAFALSDVELMGEQLAQSIGCGDASVVLTCLRAMPADQLVLAWGVTEIDGVTDGKVLPKPVVELMQQTGGTMPMLLGSGREEWGYEVYDPDLPNPMSWDQYVLFSNDFVGESSGAKARALYPPHAYESTFWAFVDLGSDAIYNCPVRTLALANHHPTYRFLSTHVMENDPSLAASKASHVTEEILLWGASNPDLLGPYTETPAEEALSMRMERYWTNFAKTGDPNQLGLPVWPRYEPINTELLILDDVTYAASGDYHASQCQYLNTVPIFPKCAAVCRARHNPLVSPPHRPPFPPH
jgi:para-nitrobenzyl esterase